MTTTQASYSRPVKTPATKREGLANAIQLAINALEAGNGREALLQMVNLLDDVTSNSNPYSVDPTAKPKKPRKAKPVA